MAVFAPEALLLRVGKAKKNQLDAFREGVYLQTASTRTIDELRDKSCADRLLLAEMFLVTAGKLTRSRPVQYRSAVSRYYYAMYHAARAATYYAHGGDDHEAHSVLPTRIPNDFPNSSYWQNELKDARLHRNEADYDPYPQAQASFRGTARNLAAMAPRLIAQCRTYVQAKGCQYL